MKANDVVTSALGNTLRSKLRTFFTVLAIVVGAFTLALTAGLGAGIGKYVDNIASDYGQLDQMFVSVLPDEEAPDSQSDLVPYDTEEQHQAQDEDFFRDMMAADPLTQADIAAIEDIEHITEVYPVLDVSTSYLELPGGEQYVLDTVEFPSIAEMMHLSAGETAQEGEMEMTIPEVWLEGFSTTSTPAEPADVIGETVTLGVPNAVGGTETVTVTITGVSEEAISGIGGNPMPSLTLYNHIYDLNQQGLETVPEPTYVQAIVDVENLAENEETVKASLEAAGYQGITGEDQMGQVQGMIDAATWVVAGFGLIALLAASFGIVNTLLMSVQERTREIGLMKALGMSSGKVFGLFSMESVLIGVMGSVIGLGAGTLTGILSNRVLTEGPLSDVVGLTLYEFAPLELAIVTGIILVIAFIAGTLPAYRAAKKDPIEALRYE